MECAICRNSYDLICLNISTTDFSSFTELDKSSWKCPSCKASLPKGNNSNTPIRAANNSNTISSVNVNLSRGSQPKPKTKTQEKPEPIDSHQIVQEIRGLRNLMDDVKTQLLSRIDALEKKLESRDKDIENLKLSVHQMQETIDLQAQRLVQNEIELIDVPETANESVYHIAEIMAKKIGVELTENDIDEAYRTGPRRISTDGVEKPARPLVIRLLRKMKRNELIKAAKVRKNISSSDIVPGTSKRIYVNERLTTANRHLFRETRLRTRQYQFRYCWIKDGRIFVRKDEGKPAITIRSALDLDQQVGPVPTPSLPPKAPIYKT